MAIDNPYYLVIAASLVIILSYFCNLIAKKTNIPSVLLLILIGILIKQGMNYLGLGEVPFLPLILKTLGTVGLIFIVLEAALDIKLSKDKWPVIWKSMVVALLGLVASSMAIAGFLHLTFIDDFTKALVYAIPLSIMSSAIIIPSVEGLVTKQKEFMIYESTFSDVLGIMFFYLLLGSATGEGDTGDIVSGVFGKLFLTLLISVGVCYLLGYLLQRITGHLKLFLTIAALLLIYSLGELYHLSSLIMILAFGISLNNYKLFWRGKLSKFINGEKLEKVTRDFHMITLESAFVIRTFFFVIFGITIALSSIVDVGVWFYSLVIVVILYSVRLLWLWLLERKAIFPLLYIAPRGLITILLFFQISGAYPDFVVPEFDEGILLFVILSTSIVMTISLIQNGLRQNGKSEKELETEAISGDESSAELPAADVDEDAKIDPEI
jgi:NhaP-type Na+/H+ or K+/H+ antiporter